MTCSIRFAAADDAPTLHRFIRALAQYEREPDAVKVTVDELRAQLGQRPAPFECLLAFDGDTPVGFGLFFHNYSTWRGRPGLYLEDLFVPPERRGRGFGRALLAALARLAVDRGCARMEWSVLDWNTPALEFYRAMGAVALDGWTTHRLTDAPLQKLAARSRWRAPEA